MPSCPEPRNNTSPRFHTPDFACLSLLDLDKRFPAVPLSFLSTEDLHKAAKMQKLVEMDRINSRVVKPLCSDPKHFVQTNSSNSNTNDIESRRIQQDNNTNDAPVGLDPAWSFDNPEYTLIKKTDYRGGENTFYNGNNSNKGGRESQYLPPSSGFRLHTKIQEYISGRGRRTSNTGSDINSNSTNFVSNSDDMVNRSGFKNSNGSELSSASHTTEKTKPPLPHKQSKDSVFSFYSSSSSLTTDPKKNNPSSFKQKLGFSGLFSKRPTNNKRNTQSDESKKPVPKSKLDSELAAPSLFSETCLDANKAGNKYKSTKFATDEISCCDNKTKAADNSESLDLINKVVPDKQVSLHTSNTALANSEFSESTALAEPKSDRCSCLDQKKDVPDESKLDSTGTSHLDPVQLACMICRKQFKYNDDDYDDESEFGGSYLDKSKSNFDTSSPSKIKINNVQSADCGNSDAVACLDPTLSQSNRVKVSSFPREETDASTSADSVEACQNPVMVRQLSCGHLFHDLCIMEWLLCVKGCCPTCKLDLNHNLG